MSFFNWWREQSLNKIHPPNSKYLIKSVYSISYKTSNTFTIPDCERNLILYIFPKQRTDVGSIPIGTPDGQFYKPRLVLTFRRIWIIPVAVFFLNFPVFTMYEKFSSLVLADFATGINGILFSIKMTAATACATFLNIPTAVGVGHYMMCSAFLRYFIPLLFFSFYLVCPRPLKVIIFSLEHLDIFHVIILQ